MEGAVSDLKEHNLLSLILGNFTESQDPETFLKKLDRFAIYGGWDDPKKLGILPLLLEGKAYDYFEGLDEGIRNDYDALKVAIVSHFQENKSKLARWNDLCEKSLLIDQSVSEIHDSINKEALKLRGSLTNS